MLERRRGLYELAQLEDFGRRHPASVCQVLVVPPANEEERQLAVSMLRRGGFDRGDLQSMLGDFPHAFRHEIDPQHLRWLADLLPEPPPPGPLDRLAAYVSRLDLESPSHWPFARCLYGISLCFVASISLLTFVAKGDPFDSLGFYLGMAFLFIPGIETARYFVTHRFGAFDLEWVATAAAWLLLAAAVLAQVHYHSLDYDLWWWPIALAILLAFETNRPFRRVMMEMAGYFACVIFIVQFLQGDKEAPFGYFCFPALLHFPGPFFPGGTAPSRRWSTLGAAASFAILTSAATLAPAGEYQRMLLGLAMVALFVFLRVMDYGLGDLVLIPPLAQIPALFFGASFDVHPALLFVYLPLVFATRYGRSRLR